jgi:hypothetical protein
VQAVEDSVGVGGSGAAEHLLGIVKGYRCPPTR